MSGLREARDREHFDSIANRFAAKDLAPSSRPARRRRVEQTIAAVPVGDFERVLDVGCGAGFGCEYLRGRYRKYIGIDHSQRLIDVAVERNAYDGVDFQATSIDDFDPPWRFDLIFMIGVLHHLEGPARSMETMAQWLEPGGFLVANEPQPANPFIRAARRARTRFDTTYSSEQEEISSIELRALFEGAGLEDIAITPQGFMSTPFAELVLRPQALMAPLARIACGVDGFLEKRSLSWLTALSWNLIGCGHAPAEPAG
jgi:SAM-dependent methyltransferase